MSRLDIVIVEKETDYTYTPPGDTRTAHISSLSRRRPCILHRSWRFRRHLRHFGADIT